MTALAVLSAVGGSLLAGACAIADGALIAGDDEPPSTRPAHSPDRARAHRALAFARTIALLLAGFGGALAIVRLVPQARFLWLLVPLLALVLGALVEAHARSLGERVKASTVLMALTRLVDAIFGPVADAVKKLDDALGAHTARDEIQGAPPPPTAFDPPQTAGYTLDPARPSGIFELADTSVREVMVPRVEIVGVEVGTPWSEVLDRVRSAEHARLPVYRDALDDIIGILYAKDLLPAVMDDEPPADGWTDLVRPAAYIPTTKTIAAQLRDFQGSRTHIAVVVDEYGGTAGIVTIEDILEEIVGEIRDEHDEEEPPVEQEEGRCFWVPGRFPLPDLEELLGHRFGDDDSTTVGGLIYSRLGRVPRSGEEITLDAFRVVVERVVRRRIERVYFERLVEAEQGSGR